ncbi:MAG: hypothetical protein ACJA16_003122 [Akkermansiaceae bacterium]|jgi:hypothetical protein
MRSGFRQAAFTSQGAHFVDPTATPEIELANKWEKRASSMDEKGLYRFSASLRSLSNSYKRDIQRIQKNR